jgi:hypothetical protein
LQLLRKSRNIRLVYLSNKNYNINTKWQDTLNANSLNLPFFLSDLAQLKPENTEVTLTKLTFTETVAFLMELDTNKTVKII